MYLQMDGREVQLRVSDDGSGSVKATVVDGKNQLSVTTDKAVELLLQRLDLLRRRAVEDITYKVANTHRLECVLRHYAERVTDVNNLLRLIESGEEEVFQDDPEMEIQAEGVNLNGIFRMPVKNARNRIRAVKASDRYQMG